MRDEQAERLVVVLSDIEMGAGGLLDDFPHTDFLAELIGRYQRSEHRAQPVDLVLNGDTFDLLKTSIGGDYPHHITEQIALAKLERIIRAHPAFFEAVRGFLSHTEAPRRVHFVVGNHDLELLMPGVQDRIRAEIDRPGVCFPGLSLTLGGLHIEHGMQADPLFAVDPAQPTILHEGEPILAVPWGSIALLDVALPLQPWLYPLDRLKPRERVLELLPEVRSLLLSAFWRYWTRDWWWESLIRRDPTRQVSWTMLKEIAHRFSTLNPEVSVEDHYQKLLTQRDDLQAIVVGHLHQPGWWSWSDRRLLQSGCLRDEYTLDRDGRIGSVLPKTYAEVRMHGERVTHAGLVEVYGPRPAPERMPQSISEVLDSIQPLLDAGKPAPATPATLSLQQRTVQ